MSGFENPMVPWERMRELIEWGQHGELALPAAAPPKDPVRKAPSPVPYAELHAHSAFSFTDGASQPGELVEQAARLGLEALALTDHNGLYGAVRLARAAAESGVGTVFGAELTLGAAEERAGEADPSGTHLLVLARGESGYRKLSLAIGQGHLRGAGKGRPHFELEELARVAEQEWIVLAGGCRKGSVARALRRGGQDAAARELGRLRELFGRDNVLVELTDHDRPGDDARCDALARLAKRTDSELVATNNVHHAGATARDWRTATALAAIRARRTLDQMNGYLAPGPSAHLRSGVEMAARFARFPGAVQRTVEVARACMFDLGKLAPRLPAYPVPRGHTESSYLRELAEDGARRRYGTRGLRPDAYQRLDYELEVITSLDLAGYFLIVWDIVREAGERGILCQGRGSAANSAVCYALGITAVNAVDFGLVFERFLSPDRDGYPDIDVDFEAGRREEIIQYVYQTYGRDRAAQVCNVITYRSRLAVRDAARVLGYGSGALDAFSKRLGPFEPLPTAEAAAGIPAQVLQLAGDLAQLPRQLGIHSGGMIILDRPVAEVVPTEWARMENRSVIQWDRDDCADAGLVKIDLLGLGMLGALHDAFDLIAQHHGERLTLGSIPPEDPQVYEMLQHADSTGLFQVESRAQRQLAGVMRPENFYDLVVSVALIRPGPIQGGAVHPYLRRRNGAESPDPPHPLLADALRRTNGIILYQEQCLQVAIAAAGFTAAEADQLRRAMGSKRSSEQMARLRARLMDGMAARGIQKETAEDIYEKIRAFSSYGFPEAHAASFAYLVYASAYCKRFYPAAFTAALLNNQPMGFYSPATLVSDVRLHNVAVRGVDVNLSGAKTHLEPPPPDYRPRHRFASPFPQHALRLGLRCVRALSAQAAERIETERADHGPYRDIEDLVRRTQLSRPALEALATAGAFGCFGLTRREALWLAGALSGTTREHLPGTAIATAPDLPAMTPIEQTIADLWSTGISPDSHPIGHLRDELAALGYLTAADLEGAADGALVRVAGLSTHIQSPPTAQAVFMSIEDETGSFNATVPPKVWDKQQRVALSHGALRLTGTLRRAAYGGTSVNVLVGRIEPLYTGGAPTRTRSWR